MAVLSQYICGMLHLNTFVISFRARNQKFLRVGEVLWNEDTSINISLKI